MEDEITLPAHLWALPGNFRRLLDLPEEKKVRMHSELFAIRVAYQHPVKVTLVDRDSPVETIARTFEDALVFENVAFFRQAQSDGAVGKFRDAINRTSDPVALGDDLHGVLKGITKAAFAAGRPDESGPPLCVGV